MSSRIALWVIAACLVALVIGGGAFAFSKWQDHRAEAERDKYREQAEFACTLVGNLPAGDEDMSLAQLQTDPAYQRCVENEIDDLAS